MSSLTSWIAASRPRTLPLSLSGIIVGISLQINEVRSYPMIAVGCLITTVLFQVLSNFANDYGDGIKGTDNANRIGPIRAIQAGIISPRTMKRVLVLISIMSALSAAFTIKLASPILQYHQVIFYGLLAVLCITAAILYTVGKYAYGYHGFGDVMVFLFFGVVAVLGTMNLLPNGSWLTGVLGAMAIGSWSTMVLNLNNLRDVTNDRSVNKNTLVVKLGLNAGRIYHLIMLYLGVLSWLFLIGILIVKTGHFSYGIALFPLILLAKHRMRFSRIEKELDYDPELKKVAIATFLHALSLLTASFLPF